MIKKLDKIDFISIVLISFSIFFWDIQYNIEIPNFQIGLRFIYLINFLIVIFYLNEDLTFNEISKRINLSESQISRIYKQAIKKIKEILT